jgi:predicted amino acid-binding ACT domain protein
MSDRWCSVTAHLQPRSHTAALLRVVSILHSRGTEVHRLTFETCDGATTMTALVTLGNVGGSTLRASLLRPLEVVDVDVRFWDGEATSAAAVAPAAAPAATHARVATAVAEHRLSLLGQRG